MKLNVVRHQFGEEATNGLLFIDGVFECYTLEDQYQEVKVMHETCIPEGTYEIKLRDAGGFSSRYLQKYGPEFHKGMLHIVDVPGFEYILIHCGNTDEHTAGCLLLGNSQENNQIKKDGFIGGSANAYMTIYPLIASAIESGKDVCITYTDISTGDIPVSC